MFENFTLMDFRPVVSFWSDQLHWAKHTAFAYFTYCVYKDKRQITEELLQDLKRVYKTTVTELYTFLPPQVCLDLIFCSNWVCWDTLMTQWLGVYLHIFYYEKERIPFNKSWPRESNSKGVKENFLSGSPSAFTSHFAFVNLARFNKSRCADGRIKKPLV